MIKQTDTQNHREIAMNSRHDDPAVPFNPEQPSPSTEQEPVNPTRRAWIKTIGKKATYTVPTLVAITLTHKAHGADFSVPPPPPGSPKRFRPR